MRLRGLGAVLASVSFFVAGAWAADARPNLSGVWLLDKNRSDLSEPPVSDHHSGGSRMGGPRMGGGGMGWPGMGGPGMGGGMGGPRMGGPRMGGPGMGGPDPGLGGTSTGAPDYGGGGSQTGGMRDSEVRSIPNKLTINHSEPQLTVSRSLSPQGDEQSQELRYTTDGKQNENILSDGRSVKSKTNWEGTQLVTKSNLKTSRGKVEITESRSLSADQKTLTVQITAKGDSTQWSRYLVYQREAADSDSSQK